MYRGKFIVWNLIPEASTSWGEFQISTYEDQIDLRSRHAKWVIELKRLILLNPTQRGYEKSTVLLKVGKSFAEKKGHLLS